MTCNDPKLGKIERNVFQIGNWAPRLRRKKRTRVANLETERHIELDILVAVGIDHVVGYGIAQIKTRPSFVRNRRYGFISDLAVTASHRRQGVGTELLRTLCQELEAVGVNQVEVGVQMQNEMSRAFWKKHGFEDVKMTVARKLTSADS